MNIAIYARVSSETQAKDGTIQSQLEALREYAQSNNQQVISECVDDGYSGADLNRPGLDQLRDVAADGLIEAVLILAPDRLSRKQANQIILLEEFKKHQVQVVFINQPIGESAEDNLLLQIQGAVSEYERAKIMDRTRRGMLHALRKGQVYAGNTPYGYKYVPKTNTSLGTYAIDEQEAEIVRLVYGLFIKKGLSGAAIARQLTKEEVPTRMGRNKWWSSIIYDILQNESYTGTAYMLKTKGVEPRKHPKLKKYRQRRKSAKVERPKEDWIAVPVPAIIERETWEKAQCMRKRNAKRSPRNNTKNFYMLRGLVICGYCGSMAPGYVSNRHTYYSCGAKRNKNITTQPHDERVAISHKKLDKKVWQGLVHLLDNPERLKEQMERRAERVENTSGTDKAEIAKVEREIKKINLQEKRLLDAYREGVIDLDELKEQKEKISAQMRIADARQRAARRPQESPRAKEITFADLQDLSAEYQRLMKKADKQTKEKLANLLINRVKLFPDKAVVEGIIPVDALSRPLGLRGLFLWGGIFQGKALKLIRIRFCEQFAVVLKARGSEMAWPPASRRTMLRLFCDAMGVSPRRIS